MILIVILGFSVSLRATYAIRAFDLGACFVPDSQSYLVPAEHLRDGRGYLNQRMEPEITRPPGYPAFLAAALTITGGDLKKVLAVQVVILSIIPLIALGTAALVLGHRVGALSATFLALSPWMIAWGARFSSDVVAVLLVSLMFFWMAAMARMGEWPIKVCWAGAFLGLSTASYVLTRPLWPVIPVVIGATWLIQEGLHPVRRTVVVLVVAVFSVAPVALWMARNSMVAGVATISDIGAKAAYGYWAQRTRSLETGVNRFVLRDEAMAASTHWQGSAEELHRMYGARAYQILMDRPVLAAEAFILNLAEQFFHPDAAAVFSGAGYPVGHGSIVLGGFWALALLTSGYGGFLVIRSWRHIRVRQRGVVLGMVLVVSLIVLSSGMSFGGGARLRLPVELLFSMMAAVGVARLFEKVRGLPDEVA